MTGTCKPNGTFPLLLLVSVFITVGESKRGQVGCDILINISFLVLWRCLTGHVHFALFVTCLDYDHVLVQTSRKKNVQLWERIFLELLPWDTESIHASGCSKYFPGVSPAYLAGIVLALHRNITSKFSLADIHQPYKEKRHKLLKTLFLGSWALLPTAPTGSAWRLWAFGAVPCFAAWIQCLLQTG